MAIKCEDDSLELNTNFYDMSFCEAIPLRWAWSIGVRLDIFGWNMDVPMLGIIAVESNPSPNGSCRMEWCELEVIHEFVVMYKLRYIFCELVKFDLHSIICRCHRWIGKVVEPSCTVWVLQLTFCCGEDIVQDLWYCIRQLCKLMFTFLVEICHVWSFDAAWKVHATFSFFMKTFFSFLRWGSKFKVLRVTCFLSPDPGSPDPIVRSSL